MPKQTVKRKIKPRNLVAKELLTNPFWRKKRIIEDKKKNYKIKTKRNRDDLFDLHDSFFIFCLLIFYL
jgi:hypothetical protein